ncbi:MAG: FecR family protein [Pseudomonas sp.]|uniref:FecR domain-containing protein n=1 Tax=Pseudomonas sp. TaxID=306 RepID=UPI003395DBD9
MLPDEAAARDYAILMQAAEWFAVLGSEHCCAQQHQQWHAWLASSPEHAAAWRRVEAISGQFQRLPDPLQRGAARSALQQGASTRRQALGLMALLCGGTALSLLTARFAPWQAWTATLRTGTGEVRESRLADDSQLWLNSGSAVDIDYGPDLRRLQLWRGELLLFSAPDRATPARPLVVDSAYGRMRAQGSRFSVREEAAATRLTVFQGAVEVRPQGGGALQLVQAGQQLCFGPQAFAPLTAAQQGRQAWRRGILQADNMRLDDFIAELAPHCPGYLGCAPAVAQLRLVGAFPLADPQRIFAALEASLPVRVVRRLPWWVSVEPRHA